jgi:hypothetical protein
MKIKGYVVELKRESLYVAFYKGTTTDIDKAEFFIDKSLAEAALEDARNFCASYGSYKKALIISIYADLKRSQDNEWGGDK